LKLGYTKRMEDLQIRKAELADAPDIPKMHVKTWQSAYKGQLPDEYLHNLSVEKRTERWQHNLSDPKPGSAHLVAVKDGVIVGFCTVGPSLEPDAQEAEGELYAIYVVAEQAGRGIGGKLMESGLRFLKDEGFKEIILWVLKTNKNTIAFYEKKGWVADGKERTEHKENVVFNDLRYRLKLA